MKNFWANKSSKATKIAIASVAVFALAAVMLLGTNVMAMDATINTIMTTIKNAFVSIYAGLLGIVSVLAAVIVGWCFIVRMYSKNPRSVDEATQWMKRVAISWLCFMMISVAFKVGIDIFSNAGANTTTPWA